MAFPKGPSGNPRPVNVNDYATAESRRKGLEKGREAQRKKREEAKRIYEEEWEHGIREAARKHVALITDGETEAVVMAAIREMYDRTIGKAVAPVEITGEDGGPMQIVVRSAFELDGDQPALLGDGETERPGEGVD